MQLTSVEAEFAAFRTTAESERATLEAARAAAAAEVASLQEQLAALQAEAAKPPEGTPKASCYSLSGWRACMPPLLQFVVAVPAALLTQMLLAIECTSLPTACRARPPRRLFSSPLKRSDLCSRTLRPSARWVGWSRVCRSHACRGATDAGLHT